MMAGVSIDQAARAPAIPAWSARVVLAWALFAVALVEVAITAVAGPASGLSLATLSDDLVISNSVIGLALAVSGWPIAWRRAGNPLGWLLLVGGICYASTGTGYAVLAAATEEGESGVGWRLLATVTNGGWAVPVGLCIPATLVLFPTGSLPSRRWRWLLVVMAVAAT